MYDLTRFTLADMTNCGAALRRLASQASSMEEAAEYLIRYLYSEFRLPERDESACSLVRLFKTHPYQDLPSDLQRFAAGVLGHEPWLPQTRCLTLLATAGDRADWNDRRKSRGHQAVPLPSEGIVESIPMIARLLSQFGLKTRDVIDPEPDMLLDLEQKNYNVFYEPNAPKSRFITAQDDFVRPEGIESCLGFGGMLPLGNLFAVIIFSKVPIAPDAASMFRTVALSAKLSLLSFEDKVFSQALAVNDPSVTASSPQELQSRLSVLEQLIEAQDLSVVDQAERSERESREIYRAVFEQGNESILVSYPEQDKIIDANEEVADMLGYSHEELLATPLSAIHPHDLDELQSFAQSVITHGRGWTNQLRCETKEGSSIRAEMSASAVEISGQQCIIALVRDIGERLAAEEAERELALVNERHRLARELHDSVTQLLYGTTLFAEAGIKEAANGHVGAVSQDLLQLQTTSLQALKEMRLLLYQLSPAELEEEGLVPALRRRLEAVESRSGVETTWEADPALDIPRFVEESLFKVAQEALNNSLKHSGASQVRVSLKRDAKDSLVLTIGDNGRGFLNDPDATKSGMGLGSMRSRVAELGGELSVESSKESGTRVQATIPLRRSEAESK